MGQTIVRNTLDQDVRTERIAAVLNLPLLHAVGALWKLWAYADEHSRNGFLRGATRDTIDQKVAIPGFSVAVEAEGWLRFKANGASIPRYSKYGGRSQKVRRDARLRMKRRRERLRERSRNVLKSSRKFAYANANALASPLAQNASASVATPDQEAEEREKAQRARFIELLVADCEQATGERGRARLYRIICESLPANDVREAISELNGTDGVRNRGALLVARCKAKAAARRIRLPIGNAA